MLNDVILKDIDINQVVNMTAIECYINHLIPSNIVSDLQIDELKLTVWPSNGLEA
jgi:hypothetical protein